jgi:outer membrane immunogenic protein
MDNVVVGVEADIGRNWNEEEFGIPATVKTTVEGSVRARVGFAFDRALVYGTAGWTATKAEADVAGDTVSDTLSGYTVGAGLDYAVTDQVFARGEYRYNDFGTGNFGGGAADFDLDQNILTIGLGLKF